MQCAQVAVTERAFAVWCCGGCHVATWGHQTPTPAEQDQLRHVQRISATAHAFAAELADGFVVTWGHPSFGGNSSMVQDRLRSVQEIHATRTAFAALLSDGQVVTWGNPAHGGDSSQAGNGQQFFPQ